MFRSRWKIVSENIVKIKVILKKNDEFKRKKGIKTKIKNIQTKKQSKDKENTSCGVFHTACNYIFNLTAIIYEDDLY